MLISTVDKALEALLRKHLPLPEVDLEVSFEPPDKTWAAKVSRVTVNLFLFEVGRSNRPAAAMQERRREDGVVERRPPDPFVDLRYLVSAWAGRVSDEHELLGEVLSCFTVCGELPRELLPAGFEGSVSLTMTEREGRRPGDVFGAVDGGLRPSFELTATCPVSAARWVEAAPLVERLQTSVSPMTGGRG
ncbi:MAG: DUF4255 domain-containing protein [Mycobacteriales bacterium]